MSFAPTMFCIACAYNLAALPEPRCPECGRSFDPSDPRTFLPRPPSRLLRTWLWRLGLPLLLFATVVAASLGWVHHDWKTDNAGYRALTTRFTSPRPPAGFFTYERVAPEWVARLVGQSRQHLFDRLVRARIQCHRVSDAEIEGIRKLHHLKSLDLYYVRLTDDRSAFLAEMKELRQLDLRGNSDLSNGTLAHIQNLPHLHTLKVGLTGVTDPGVDHLLQMKNLESLQLPRKLTPAAVARLAQLPRLKHLDLTSLDHARDALAHLRHFPALEVVEVYINADAQTLTDLAAVPNLKRLVIRRSGERSLSSAQLIQFFQTHRPDVSLRAN